MTDKADKSLKESLSALTDGEASEIELHRILKNSHTDADTGEENSPRRVWSRYQMIGSVMRGEWSGRVENDRHVDLSSRIAEAISSDSSARPEEPASVRASVADTPKQALPRWVVGAGQTAVAAMVALAVIVGVNPWGVSNDPAEQSSELVDTHFDLVDPYVGDGAIVPEGYRVPAIQALTVSGAPSAKPKAAMNSIVVSGNRNFRLTVNEQTQQEMQRLFSLHAMEASNEVGLKVAPFAPQVNGDSAGE